MDNLVNDKSKLMASSRKEELIKKLRAGSCTEEELDQLFRLAKAFPENEARDLMDQLWSYLEDYPSLEKNFSEKMFANVMARIKKRNSGAPFLLKDQSMGRRRFLVALSSAAAVLLLAVFGTWWSQKNNLITIATVSAEQREVILPDGSTVILNANSRLTYRSSWKEGETRRVWLEGEAFFEVAEKPKTQQKFLVNAPDLIIEVLGTVFNVNSYHEQTNVYLEEGKIALKLKNKPQNPTIMKPGEMITYSSKKKSIIAHSRKTATRKITSWKNGSLLFENEPMERILRKIEAIYGIEFVVKDHSILQRQFTTGLPMDELEFVIPLLEKALGITIRKNNRQYIIQKNGDR